MKRRSILFPKSTKKIELSILIFLIFSSVFSISAQESDELWSKTTVSTKTGITKKIRKSNPSTSNIYDLNISLLKSKLANAPKRNGRLDNSIAIVSFPNGSGTLERYEVFEASIMEEGLQNRFPSIRSYVGKNIDNPSSTIRFSVTTMGLNALILNNAEGAVYIEPYTTDAKSYMVYFSKNLPPSEPFDCGVDEVNQTFDRQDVDSSAKIFNADDGYLRTFRLAVTATGEYSQYHLADQGISEGATDEEKKAAVLSAINVTMTNVNAVFERDLGLTMVLVDNNTDIIFLDPDTDNLTGEDRFILLGEIQPVIDDIIGTENYDIGHGFGGYPWAGVAGLNVVCNPSSKAFGVSGDINPIGAYFEGVVMHEMGHQYGSHHTFNTCQDGYGYGFEPGCGWAGQGSILSYAGNFETFYFHLGSIRVIWENIKYYATCSSLTSTGNNAPTIEDIPNYTIPISTPFALNAVASDLDNDNLTYAWDQLDTEIIPFPLESTATGGPAFGALPPTTSSMRYFPQQSTVVTGALFNDYEVLPSVSRTMTFGIIVRDNNINGGQTASEETTITVDGNSGPFNVTSQASPVTWEGGTLQTITWDVANTNASPINCTDVNILLSLDGGYTYPTVLASNVANDGLYVIAVPNISNNSARLKVESVGNIFYAMNASPITITAQDSEFAMIFTSPDDAVCSPNDAVYIFTYKTFSGFNEETIFSATDNPNGATVTFNPISATANNTVVEMTVSDIQDDDIGNHNISVIGTSASTNKTTNVPLYIYGSVTTPNLVSPLNNAIDVLVPYLLSWDNDVNAANYEIQLATDDTFSSIVESTIVISNSFEATSQLLPNTSYFWRVKSINICSESPFSNVYSFTTSPLIYIPDDNFEQALIDFGYDDVLDDYVLPANINTVTYLDVSDRGISDLTGIEAFTSLKELYCGGNQISSLNLSSNIALEILHCQYNQLTSLDVTQNSALTILWCFVNQLPSLNVIQNPSLVYLYCWANQLTSLDVTQNTALVDLGCGGNQISNLDLTQMSGLTILTCEGNQLTSLDVTQNTALVALGCGGNYIPNLDVTQNLGLTTLTCNNNPLHDLDVSQNTALKTLNCDSNQLTSLDISQNTDLVTLICSANQLTDLDVTQHSSLDLLFCYANQLTDLDLSQNIALVTLYCSSNLLESLNVKNGNNNAINALGASNNPNLYCIQVDDAAYSAANWTDIDAQTGFSENCRYNDTYVPDDNFEQALIDLGYDTGVLDDYVPTANINYVTYLAVGDKNISDLTGIEAFTALTYLHCRNNQLMNLNVTQSTDLTILSCSENLLTELDITQNTALIELYCFENQLTNLDVSENTALTELWCPYNQITSLDVSKNTNLTELYCWDNPLSNLDVTQNIALTVLHCYYNQLTSLDVSQNAELTMLFCGGNPLVSLDVSQNIGLTSLSCGESTLSSLNVSQNTALTTLNLFDSNLTNLDLSQNTGLEFINCSYNNLASLNTRNGNNTAISGFISNNNPNLSCIEVDDATWSATNWTNIDPQSYFSENCFSLPSDNFGIEVISETCPGKNNGQISILANETHDYETTINGVDYNFTSDLLVTDLPPGNYEFCISVPAEDYTQCFTIEVIEGTTTSGRSSQSSGRISITIDKGTAPFKVFVNNEIVLQSHSNTFDVTVGHGDFVEVKTDKDCEGTYAKTIGLVDKLIGYPNPTTGAFEIALPVIMEEVTISLYSIQAKLLSTASYPVKNGKVQLDIKNNANGIYFAKVYLDEPVTLKILKQ